MKNVLSVLGSISLSVFFLSCEKSSDSDLNNLAMDLESKKGGNKKALFIGMEYQGGIIFYLDETGQHGLIAAKEDLGPAPWGCYGTSIPGAQSMDDGYSNTQALLANCSEQGIATRLCDEYMVREKGDKGKKYDDWFMPAWSQFTQIMRQLNESSGFCNKQYWISTEATGGFQASPINSATSAWTLSYSCSVIPGSYGLFFMPGSKKLSKFVRPIRAF